MKKARIAVTPKISVKEYMERLRCQGPDKHMLFTKTEADSKPFKMCNDAYDGDSDPDEYSDIPAD